MGVIKEKAEPNNPKVSMAKEGEKDVKVEEDAAKSKYPFSEIYDYVVHKTPGPRIPSDMLPPRPHITRDMGTGVPKLGGPHFTRTPGWRSRAFRCARYHVE